MTAKLTIGPILFHWPAEKQLEFYARIADEAPVDTVYLGEVICSKRSAFMVQHYDVIAERLKRGGKKVVYSTLSEVLIKRDRKDIKGVCDIQDEEEVEANDASALFHLSGKPHRLGPWMNVYNEDTLKFLAAKGAYHASLPAELYKDSIAVLGEAAKKLRVALEVQVFGRVPLALSARCYHARAHQLSKDNCQFVCEKDPDGMLLNTLGGQQFLAINGIQTLSDTYLNLTGELEELQAMGVSYFRLSPHSNDMVETANVFNRLIEGQIDSAEATSLIQATGDVEPFSNGFYHHQPGHKWSTAS